MRCMNSACGREVSGAELKLYQNKVAVCSGCCELAEKAERAIDRQINQARETAKAWLVEHVLSGGIFRGGSGAEGVTVEVKAP